MATQTPPSAPSRSFYDAARPYSSDDEVARRLQPLFKDWRRQPPDLSVVRALVRVARSIGANPAHVIAVVQHESGFCPKAQNGENYSELGTHPFNPTKAQGLLQFTPGTAAKLGTTPAAIRAMTAAQQADLVGEYMRRITGGRPADSLYKVALSVFYPKYVPLPPTTPFPSDVQARNPGIVTPVDYVRKVYGKLPMRLLEAIGRGEEVEGAPSAAGTPPEAPERAVVPPAAVPPPVAAPSVPRVAAAAGGGLALTLAAGAVLYLVTR